MARVTSRSATAKWGLGFAVVVAVALAAGAAFLLRPSRTLVQVAAAKRANLVAQVQCDGVLEAPPGSELRAPEAGLVAELSVRDGDPVRAGEVVLRLENSALASQQRQAETEVLRLQAEVSEAEAGWEKAKRDVQHWRDVVAADRRLLDEAAATRSELDADELALSDARDRARAGKEQVAALRGPSAQEHLARTALAAASRRIRALVLRSPREGVVYGLPAHLGELVQQGQLLASIADPDRPRVRVRVDQPDLPRIAVGQRLVLTFSGLPGREWEGRVTAAAAVLREVDGRKVGEVDGEISDPQHLLPLNASVDARIVLARRLGVLTVPRAALYREGGRRFVYRLRGGRAHRQEVTVGLVGLTEVEIASGLAAGDRVVLAGEVPLVEGLRVTPAD
jgi:RND family efflux transporter MFP subunit